MGLGIAVRRFWPARRHGHYGAGGVAAVCGLQTAGYPLIPVSAMPEMKYFCARKKRIRHGAITISETAMR